MFSAIVTKDALESFIDRISPITDEAKLHLEDGFRVRAVDPANVAMADVELDAGAFESYEADDGLIGINISRFADVVGFADSGELIHLDLDEETRKLHIEAGGLEYTLALIDPDTIRQEPDIPEDLELPAEVIVEGRQYSRGVKAADMVSDHIAFGVDAEEAFFYVDAEGDIDDVHLELDDEDLLNFTVAPAHSLYSLEYMEDIEKAVSADTELTLHLGDEFPILIDFEIAEGEGHCQYMVAPRIQSS